MIVVWGSKLYGKTDEVPGIFHVATKFWHLWYLPLIPMGTCLVLDETSDESRGVRIPFSYKSVLLAWGRAAAIVLAVFLGFLACRSAFRGHFDVTALVLIVCDAAAFGLFLELKYMRPFRYASYDRAMELAALAQFDERGKTLLLLYFGMINEDQAREILSQTGGEDPRDR